MVLHSGDPKVYLEEQRLRIGFPNGLIKIAWGVSQQAKEMLKDFLCRMSGSEVKSGLLLEA